MLDGVIAKIRRLNEDDLIWIIYFFIIGTNLFTNDLERKNIDTNSKSLKSRIKSIDTTTLVIAFLIYVFYCYRNYHDLKELKTKSNTKAVFLSEVALIGSILFLIGGAITIYVVVSKPDDDELGII